jgi:endoribonuclease Dicer
MQRRTMEGFRQGTFNVLVSTNVGSEGLDFRQCGLVVAVHPPTNTISLVQCRGRARRPGSRYLLLVDERSGAAVACLMQ